MPVIGTVDPLSVASEAVGSYFGQKRQNELEAAARQYQQGRDARHDMESDRSFGLEQERAGDQHAMTMSQIQSQEQQRRIQAADEAFTRSMDGINRQIAGAQLKGVVTANALAAVELRTRAITAQYARDLAKAGLSQAQAQAKAAQAAAQFAPQQAAANLAQTQASTAQTRAQTGLTAAETAQTQKSTSLLGTDAFGYGRGRGGRSTAGERAQSAYDEALQGLSQVGTQFVEMLYNTNNPPTRGQAMLALQAAQRGSGLSKDDVSRIRTIIESKQSQFESPSAQAAQERFTEHAAAVEERHRDTGVEKAYTDVTRGKSFAALPPQLREMVRHVLVDQRLSIQQALQQLPGAPIPDDQKQAIARALTGQ